MRLMPRPWLLAPPRCLRLGQPFVDLGLSLGETEARDALLYDRERICLLSALPYLGFLSSALPPFFLTQPACVWTSSERTRTLSS